MLTITDAIKELSQFSTHDGVPEILDDLADLKKDSTENKMEVLRKKLTSFLSSEPAFNGLKMQKTIFERFDFFNFFQNKNGCVFDAAYNTLLALAELKPINDADPISWAEITPKNKIFTSTGHQFDIITLIAFNNQRVSLEVNKSILNIMTNQPFSPRDTAHIQDVIQQRVKNLGKVKSVQAIQKEKTTCLVLAVFSFLKGAGHWASNEGKNERAAAVIIFSIAFILLGRALSLPNHKEIEEEPLLNYKPT